MCKLISFKIPYQCHRSGSNNASSFLGVLYGGIDLIVTPFNQHFSLRNYTIQYPYAVKERIPIPLAFVLCIVIPMLVIAIYALVIDGIFSHRCRETGASWTKIYRLKDRLWELNCGILGLFLAEGAALVITGSLKNLCGKPRPDLIARCQPYFGAVDPPVFGLSNSTICTQTDQAIMADGFRSFPSGHSSTAFAGLFYLSLYLAAKLHVLDNRGEVWRTTIVLIPTLAASCIAMSRIMDARHHPFDVLFGSAMGILVAWAAYRQYFPPVGESWNKGRAYPIRTWGTEIKGPPLMGGSGRSRKEDADSELEPYHVDPSSNISRTGVQGDPTSSSSQQQQYQQERENDNVFRAQISRSQLQRAGTTTTADISRYANPRTQRDNHDEWSATSSEDEEYRAGGSKNGDSAGVHAGQGFEMQRPSNLRGSSMRTDSVRGPGPSIRHLPPNAAG